MKTIKQQSEEYALKYPSEIRNEIAKAWIDEETGEILEKNSLKELAYKTITNETNIEKNGTIKRVNTIKRIRIIGKQTRIQFD